MRSIVRALLVLCVLTLLTGIAYPLLVTGIATLAFPHEASGSPRVHDGKVVGSALLAQPFTDPRWFWPRPSATSPAWNPAASSGSNLGPSNPALVEAIRRRVEALRAADPG
ncbi:MAG: potassium-transporting ATPase subunit C, partial [Planctomycetes bacterium]|nr:potassium-transporting ATPase subunit C [Planctomycetota bacterium]